MRWKLTVPMFATFVVLTAILTAGQQSPGDSKQPAPGATNGQPNTVNTDQGALIKRGEYLVNNVALCVICHSPKDADGNPIPGEHFKGDVIPVRPSYATLKTWAERAPALGPIVGGAGDDVEHLLQTGIWLRTGTSPRRPMPPFRMNKEDAHAVVTYLKSATQ